MSNVNLVNFVNSDNHWTGATTGEVDFTAAGALTVGRGGTTAVSRHRSGTQHDRAVCPVRHLNNAFFRETTVVITRVPKAYQSVDPTRTSMSQGCHISSK
jgi:hypothetical protein